MLCPASKAIINVFLKYPDQYKIKSNIHVKLTDPQITQKLFSLKKDFIKSSTKNKTEIIPRT